MGTYDDGFWDGYRKADKEILDLREKNKQMKEVLEKIKQWDIDKYMVGEEMKLSIPQEIREKIQELTNA